MKTITQIIITAVLLISVLFAYSYYQKNQSVTRVEFQQVHTELRKEIDTVKMQLDSVQIQLHTLEHNQDSLKAGQVIIYKQIKEQSSTNFFDNLIEFMQ